MSDHSVVDLDEIMFSRYATNAYLKFVEQVGSALSAAGLMPRDPKNVPLEQGRLEADGTLTIFVELPTGIEVAMNVPKGHWAWARRQ
ncbi:hypothetical protein A2851_05550 [Candidatus Kaiserbacteria bacterium RIFCSPHIGHO2_01_FULL_53_29]|nr:MAG: hypothetical protein A2851_05550 [Candidatus Kaiserbacteria bacterium RIFCSPHIGHO2_01_FULL_53_29]